jgi:hypothetical protein
MNSNPTPTAAHAPSRDHRDAHQARRTTMTDIAEHLASTHPEQTTNATPAPVLITTAEVALATAAAKPFRPTTGWPTRIFAAVHTAYRTLTDTAKPGQPRHHPKRYLYIDDARMHREMERL